MNIDKTKYTVENQPNGDILLKKIEEEIKFPKWEDLERINGYYISGFCSIDVTVNVIAKNTNKNIYPSKSLANAALAQSQLLQLRDYVNNGWIPNWESNQENKYVIILNVGKSFTIAVAYRQPSLFYFKTKEIAEQFILSYSDLLEQYKPLLGM